MKIKSTKSRNIIPAYVLTSGCKLSRKNTNIIVETPEKKKSIIRVRTISSLTLLEPASISAQVLELCARVGVIVIFINRYGRLLSKVSAYSFLSSEISSLQLSFSNNLNNLKFANKIVLRKIISQKEFLIRSSYKEKVIEKRTGSYNYLRDLTYFRKEYGVLKISIH